MQVATANFRKAREPVVSGSSLTLRHAGAPASSEERNRTGPRRDDCVTQVD